MGEHERRNPEEAQDDVKLPDERVEDLEPDAGDTEDVKGGGTWDWWRKVEGGSDG